MKLFVAALGTETNSFSCTHTTMRDFEDCLLWRPGDAPLGQSEFAATSTAALAWAREGQNREIVEGTCAHACPGGVTTRETYEALRDEILAQLTAALPVDGVALTMHGAMIAEGYEDCEGDFLARAREIVGPEAVIGVELDLHGHLTDIMTTAADILITFKEYPHTDYMQRAEELVTLIEKSILGDVKPRMSVFDCHMIDAFHTTQEPMLSLVREISELEKQPEVLSISIVHSFPWGDVADLGAKVLVVTNDAREKGAAMAHSIGLRLFSLRGAARAEALGVEEALTVATSMEGERVVIADTADNPGGGAPGDSTHFLEALLRRKVKNVCLGPLYDPAVVQQAFRCGMGATLEITIGGKLSAYSGAPVAIKGHVVGLRRGATQSFAGSSIAIGDAAAIDCDGVRVVITSQRVQGFSPDLFEAVGVNPRDHKIIIVKSSQHFRDAFDPIADRVIYAQAPGLLNLEAGPPQYKHLKRRLWPIHEISAAELALTSS